jgi:hypothetical protein
MLPEPTIRPEVAGRSLVARPLHGVRFVRPLGIIHRRQPRLTLTARSFLELLCGQEGNGRPIEDGLANGAGGNGRAGSGRRSRHGAAGPSTKQAAD